MRIFSVEPVTIASGPMNPHNDTTQNDTILAEIIKINRLNKLSKFPAIPGLKMIDDLPTLYKLKRIGVTNANVSYYKISFTLNNALFLRYKYNNVIIFIDVSGDNKSRKS